MRYFGAHVSVAGGLHNAISSANTLNINTIQVHPTAPQRWITQDIESAGIETMIKEQKKSSVKMIFAHAIYLINLAQPDKQKFHLSKLAVTTYLNFMGNIETIAKHYDSDLTAGGVVVHLGSAIHYPERKEAIERVVYGINWILENAPKGMLLIESSAGAGQVIGERIEELLFIRDSVEQKERVGITLDTQHMFASGYDWHTPQVVFESTKVLFEQSLVKLIHLNDSKTALNSKKDRHENLGEGEIGNDAFTAIVNHPYVKNVPLVLETPRMKSIEDARIDIEHLRLLISS